MKEEEKRKDLDDLTRYLLKLVHETHLVGHQKLWLYQHLIIPKISWHLEILDLCYSFAKMLHHISLSFIKKWAGLPKAANTAILFTGNRERPGLRLMCITTLWKQQQTIKWHIIKHSKDHNIAQLYCHHRKKEQTFTRRFSPVVELECAETAVWDTPASRPPRAGLGFVTPKARVVKPRKQILNTIREGDCQEQLRHLKGLQMQGAWTKWADTMFEDMTWRKLLYEGYGRTISFQMNAILNTLPSPDNLRRWGNSVVDQNCPLCQRTSTLRHILTACPSSLHQGRYTWRHDNVLKQISKFMTEVVSAKQKSSNTEQTPTNGTYITFCKPGQNMPHGESPQRKGLSDGFLSGSHDWQLLSDLEERLVFPHFIAPTTCRPDIVLFSKKLRRVLWLELTVCSEDRIIQSREKKLSRYRHLKQECMKNGWEVEALTAEVGARGAISSSLDGLARALGCCKEKQRQLRRNCRNAALNSSYVIWLRRREKAWRDWPLF